MLNSETCDKIYTQRVLGLLEDQREPEATTREHPEGASTSFVGDSERRASLLH